MILLFSTEFSSSLHLACEEILLKSNDEILFLYSNENSVIMGANQNWEYEVNRTFCEENQINIRRRISGGGTVFHDLGNVNYCFIRTKKEASDTVNTEFLKPVQAALRAMDINTQIGTRKDLWVEDIKGKKFKISGTASHVSKGRILQHGTLLFDTNLDLLQNAISPLKTGKTSISSVRSEVMNLREFLKIFNLKDRNSSEFYDILIEKFIQLLKPEKVLKLNEYINLHPEIFSHLSTTLSKFENPDFIFKK